MTRMYVTRGQQLSLLPKAKGEREEQGNRGMALEHALMVMHELYEHRGFAVIRKNYVQSKVVGDGRLARVEGAAIVDFSGVLDDGRHVAFDAKDCKDARIPLDALRPHQLEYLGEVDALGGMAFVLVRFRRKFAFRVPADVWADAEYFRAYGKPIRRVDGWTPKNRSSLTLDDMRPEWAMNGCDWLGRVEANG